MSNRSLTEPPDNAGDGQAEEPCRRIYLLDNHLGDGSSEDDRDRGPGGCPENLHYWVRGHTLSSSQ